LHQVRYKYAMEPYASRILDTKRAAENQMLNWLHNAAQNHNGADIWACRICLGERNLEGKNPNPIHILGSKYGKFGLFYSCISIARGYDVYHYVRNEEKVFKYSIEIRNLPGNNDSIKSTGSGKSAKEAKMDAATAMLKVIHQKSIPICKARLSAKDFQSSSRQMKEEKKMFFERIKAKNAFQNNLVHSKASRGNEVSSIMQEATETIINRDVRVKLKDLADSKLDDEAQHKHHWS